jgi:hypothetical protein
MKKDGLPQSDSSFSPPLAAVCSPDLLLVWPDCSWTAPGPVQLAREPTLYAPELNLAAQDSALLDLASRLAADPVSYFPTSMPPWNENPIPAPCHEKGAWGCPMYSPEKVEASANNFTFAQSDINSRPLKQTNSTTKYRV